MDAAAAYEAVAHWIGSTALVLRRHAIKQYQENQTKLFSKNIENEYQIRTKKNPFISLFFTHFFFFSVCVFFPWWHDRTLGYRIYSLCLLPNSSRCFTASH